MPQCLHLKATLPALSGTFTTFLQPGHTASFFAAIPLFP
jgi:hypothetical protein